MRRKGAAPPREGRVRTGRAGAPPGLLPKVVAGVAGLAALAVLIALVMALGFGGEAP